MKNFFLSLMIALIIPLLKVNTVTAADPAGEALAGLLACSAQDFALEDPNSSAADTFYAPDSVFEDPSFAAADTLYVPDFVPSPDSSALFDGPNQAASYHFPAPAIPADLLNQDELSAEGAEAEASDSDEESQESSQNAPGFLCSYCDEVLSTQFLYHTHCQKAHKTKRYTYVCSECKKQFKSPSGLTQHLRKHTGEKPYSCITCTKTFNSSSNLRKHKGIHTGERQFTCTVCDKNFVAKRDLRRHSRSCTATLAALASTLDPQ